MNKIKTKLILALVVLVGISVPGVALSNSHGDHKKPMAAVNAKNPMAAKTNAAIEMADKARKKAASVKGEWRDTGKFIKKAKAAAKKGDYAKALKLAKKAEAEGHLGYEQAVAQKELRLPSYLKY